MKKVNHKATGKKGGNLWIDGYLHNNLEIIKKAVKEDRDAIIAVDGYEGSGKSVLAFQVAASVDPEFDIDQICFTAEEFAKRVSDAQKYTAIVYDEARSGLNARRSMSSINVTLTNMLAEIRQKNLYIILVLPSFFDLDKNVAIWRSMALLHVVEKYDKVEKKLKRGFFKWFNRDEKKYLYVAGKKFYNYRARCSFEGTFKKFYPVDQEEYKKRKAQTLKRYDKELTTNKSVLDLENPRVKKHLHMEMLKHIKSIEKDYGLKVKQKDIAKYVGVAPSTVAGYKKEEKINFRPSTTDKDNPTKHEENVINKE